jgi:RND family efflux transporter MFP subunit
MCSKDWDRARKLYGNNGTALADVERSERDLVEARMNLRSQQANCNLVNKGPRVEKIAASRAEVRRAQANRDRAKYYLDQTKIYAPDDGTAASYTLLERKVAAGESIQADLTYTPLCSLADLTHMEVEVDVQERDLGAVVIGAPCEIMPDAYPERVYRGKIHRKQPIVNRQRGVLQVKITIEAPDEYLLPDMNARVLLLNRPASTAPAEDLPQLPSRALVFDGGAPAVFVVEAQAARLRRIETGATVGDAVQVRGGLRPGDRVILPGGQALRDGLPVQVPGANPPDGEGKKERS